MTKWIIPCNLKSYNVVGAFDELSDIDWKQSFNPQIGDIIFIYVSAPVKQIKYMCEVVDVNKPSITIEDTKFHIDPTGYATYPKHMQLHLLKTFDDERLTITQLKENGLKGNIQGPMRVKDILEDYIETIIG